MMVILVGLAGGLISALIASGKRRNAGGWFVIGFLLPLIGVILAIVLPPGSGGLDADPALLAPSPVPPTADPRHASIAALERLAALRDRGALTTEEFEAQKAALLDGQTAPSGAATSPRAAATITCPSCQRQVPRAMTVMTEHGELCDRCHAIATSA